MRKQPLDSIYALLIVASAMLGYGLIAPSIAVAQGPPVRGNLGVGMGMIPPSAGRMTDVTHSVEQMLLGRQDVRKELMLSGRQQAQVDDLIQKQQEDLFLKQAQAMQQL